MRSHIWLVVAVVLALVGTHQTAGADPITYDFTGTLAHAVDGSKTFSGSLTFNTTPTPDEVQYGGSTVVENGRDVSLTVNVGGGITSFVNTPQNPYYISVQANVVPTEQQTSAAPEVEFSVSAGYNGFVSSQFSMSFYSLGVGTLPANLATLPLSPGTSSVGLLVGTSEGSTGRITSIEVVSAPEPSMLAVFAGLGIAALVRRRNRQSRGRVAGWPGKPPGENRDIAHY